jgi:hypothetical protein
LLDHSCAQIGIDQTAFCSDDCIVKRSNRNLFFSGKAREPRTFKDIHFRLPDFLLEYHTRCYQNQGRLKMRTAGQWAPQRCSFSFSFSFSCVAFIPLAGMPCLTHQISDRLSPTQLAAKLRLLRKPLLFQPLRASAQLLGQR